MIYIKVCYFILLTLLFLKGLTFLLSIFQEEHYHVLPFLSTLHTFYFKKYYNYLLYIALLIPFTKNTYLYALGAFLCFVGLIFKDKLLIKIKLTKRIIRLLVSLTLFLTLSFLTFKNIHYVSLLYFFTPFIIIFLNFVNFPLEALIRLYYIKKARKKLAKLNTTIKIAITGSFGKTSSKNIITSILENKYLTVKTPESYNTMMGITKVINKDLTKSCEVFICEMGATKPHEISKMATLIKPDICLITDVGLQHISTFKTLENVLNAKFELLTTNKEDTLKVLNGDNPLIKKRSQNLKNTIYYGLEETNTISAKNITITPTSTSFDIYQEGNKEVSITTKLLGRSNVKNILASYALVKALKEKGIKITNEEFKLYVSNLERSKHRLSYHKVNNIHLYDDSFSQNLEGFKNATEVIKKVPFKRIIITPGIVDTGKMTKVINEKVANLIKETFDEAYIIDNNSGRYIYNELSKTNSIHLSKSFKKAYQDVLKKKEELALLIANDLPDNYLVRRKKNEQRR